MPLDILIMLVMGGIAWIGLLLHLTGRSEKLLLDDERAQAGWLRQFPDDQIDDVRLARNRRSALVLTDAGLGVIWSIGADTVARHIQGAQLTPTSSGLVLRFRDHAAPFVKLAPDPTARDQRASELRQG